MDGVSAATGTITVIDACVKVTRYLKELKNTTKSLDSRFAALCGDADRSLQTCEAIRDLASSRDVASDPAMAASTESNQWDAVATHVEECSGIAQRLNDLVQEIKESSHHTGLHGVEQPLKARKLLSNKVDIDELQHQSAKLTNQLNLQLSIIQVRDQRRAYQSLEHNLEQRDVHMAQSLQHEISKVHESIDSLRMGQSSPPTDRMIQDAERSLRSVSMNKIWQVPRSVVQQWMGRTNELEDIQLTLLPPPQTPTTHMQKRYALYGLPGCGKTQLALKFAQEYRDRFWGVFWVDASSTESAEHSWKMIAKRVRGDFDVEGAKEWLQNLDLLWLLIIDNADDFDEGSLETHFPTGDRGCVLITTRSPRLAKLATSCRDLTKLKDDEAVALLNVTSKVDPWDDQAAANIASFLGYLPLALIQAGQTIAEHYCKLSEYIELFKKLIKKTKGAAMMPEGIPRSDQSVFTSFHMNYSRLERASQKSNKDTTKLKDALELLNILAYFHKDDITQETLIKAGDNRQPRAKEDGEDAGIDIRRSIKRQVMPWVNTFPQAQPVFPNLIGNRKTFEFDSTRVTAAIGELVDRSMLSEDSGNQSFSMHPLVQQWLRQRHENASVARAWYIQAATNILATSVKLLDQFDVDALYYLRLLPHIKQVQGSQQDLVNDLQKTSSPWTPSSLITWVKYTSPSNVKQTRFEASNIARFSRVYHESANYTMAATLQRQARNIIVTNFGPEDALCARISVLLSISLWHNADSKDAFEMQQQALKVLPGSDADALRLLDAMGETLWLMGRPHEAKEKHEAAIAGMKERSSMEKDLYKAVDHLGRAYQKLQNADEARARHEEAIENLQRLSETEIDVLMAKDNLASALLQFGGGSHWADAEKLMGEVLEGRKSRLGKSHPYTLWASCNLAQCKALLGSQQSKPELIQEAKNTVKNSLRIAERVLGKNQAGTLLGRQHLAFILLLEGQYAEAENELRTIMDRQKRIGFTIARCETMDMLANCYEWQQRSKDAAEMYAWIVEELSSQEYDQHPLKSKAQRNRDELLTHGDALLEPKRLEREKHPGDAVFWTSGR